MTLSTESHLAITVEEAAQQLSVGKHLLYRLIEEGDFPAIRVGKKRLIVPVEGFNAWVKKNMTGLVK